jgi:uncharacterized protein (TIGR02145 family)
MKYKILLLLLFTFLFSCDSDNNSNNSFPVSCDSVIIGSQVWMGCNLNVDHYRNGDPIPQVTDSTQWVNTDSGAWCYYNNSRAIGAIYGKLYNWYAVHDSRGLAPVGWHVPSNAEWSILLDYLGGEKIAGGKLKDIGTAWNSPNTGATNDNGFSALPGGHRFLNGSFYALGTFGSWWTASVGNIAGGYFRYMRYDSANVVSWYGDMNTGISVRCVRD